MGGYRIEASGVRREAGTTRLLDSVHFAAFPGELVALVGPSGAGKSTLLKTLIGSQRPDAGQILYDGVDLYADPARFARQIGFVPQDDLVHTSLTVQSSLVYALKLRRPEMAEAAVEARVETVLAQLELTARRGLKVGRLSGGQRKRVSIGVELVSEPAVLFLDEPTSGLDPALEARMMQLFATLAREGRTVILTTHVMDSLEAVDQLAVLYSGQLAFFGPPRRALEYFDVEDPVSLFTALEAKPPSEWRKAFSSSPDAARALRREKAPPPPPAPAAILNQEDALDRELEALKEELRGR